MLAPKDNFLTRRTIFKQAKMLGVGGSPAVRTPAVTMLADDRWPAIADSLCPSVRLSVVCSSIICRPSGDVV